MSMWKSEDSFVELILPFHLDTCAGDGTQVLGL